VFRSLKERMSKRRADRRAAKPERAQRKAEAEARRLEHLRKHSGGGPGGA
jgi:hypothetical protein